jgi:hypothetical protein
MKKSIIAVVLSGTMLLAGDTTITATMNLMNKGLNQVQAGFVNNNRKDILNGIDIIENANSIFTQVDVTKFIPNNRKTQVTKNIYKNLAQSLKVLKDNVENKRYSAATESYGKVLNTCLSCHTIIRGW